MGDIKQPTTGRRRRRDAGGSKGGVSSGPVRVSDYRHLRHPFAPQTIFSEDEIAAIHDTALRVLEELGLKILLPEGREIFRAAGALVDDETEMVRIGRDIVTAALETAPRSFRMRAPNPEREQIYEPGTMLFTAGAGCPNATDRIRGRRPGTFRDYEEALRLQQSFDVIHKLVPSVEPQDIPAPMRHYAMMQAQIANCDKPMFVYSRGTPQVEDCFAMIRQAYRLGEEEFTGGVWATTVINSNSPRQLDRPMTQGIIDFARSGQLSVITPFCLAGAMAPITISGALTLQHAESMAGIALAQLVRPGTPVSYGGFSSNVDMKSGSPAFGTPEHVKATLGSGQLARHIGFPWRSAMGAASNAADAQGAHETLMSGWATLLAGATMIVHAAGWLEGGLSFGYEKFILDIEALQSFAELTLPSPADADSIGFHALADVQPGGHFFATDHTMTRYQTAFYAPLVADLSNFGRWQDSGGQTATERATGIWQEVLDRFTPPPGAVAAAAEIEGFVAHRISEGGAPPES